MISLQPGNPKSPIIKVAVREWRRIISDKRIYLLMVVAPILLSVLLSLVYSQKAVMELPVAVCDQDNTELSRMIIRYLDADRSIKMSIAAGSVEEIEKLFRQGKIQGAIYLTNGLEADVKSGRQANCVVYINGSNLIFSNLITKAASGAIRTVNAGANIKKFKAMGLKGQAAIDKSMAIKTDTLPLFNPGYNYLNFLVPGMVIVLFQMIVIMLSSQLINTEIEENTATELLGAADNSLLNIVLGKSIIHILIHTCTAIIIFGWVFAVIDIPFQGSLISGLIFLLYFITVVHFLGMALSFAIGRSMFAMEISVFVNAPAFVFSGYTFPIGAMPIIQQVFAYMMPFTHFLTGFIKLYQIGTPLSYLLPEIGKLAIILAISLALICIIGLPKPLKAPANIIVSERGA